MKIIINEDVLEICENSIGTKFSQEDCKILQWLYKIVHSEKLSREIGIISGIELNEKLFDDNNTYYSFTLKRMFKDLPKIKRYFMRYKFDESYFQKFAQACIIHLYYADENDTLNDNLDGDIEIIFRLDEKTEVLLFKTE